MSFLEAVGSRVLVADGAMGTELQKAELPPGGCGEAWNLDAPDRVLGIQRAYVQAGADIILTNTFGGCRIMLARHDEAERVREINRAGAELARRAFGDGEGFVLGDIGPFGGLMEPYGDIPESQVATAFTEQAQALVEGGVDGILIETQTSLEELALGIRAARSAGAACIIGSMAFDKMQESEEVRTMMGVSPEQAAEFMADAGCDVVALNCGTGVDMNLAADTARRYRSACALPVMAKPNAGLPVVENMKVVYRESPEQMASGVPSLLDAGVRVIGGCCGSTPEHIRKIREVVDREIRARS